MEKVSRSPDLVESVKTRLFEAILTGKLKPGDKLRQEDIAVQLGVSRQPVSHAMRILFDQGILAMHGAKSLSVAEIDSNRLKMILAIRIELDCYAAERAAKRYKSGDFTKSDVSKLNKLELLLLPYENHSANMADFKQTVSDDITFHQLLRSLSGNELIEDTLAPYILHYHRLMYLTATNTEQNIWSEHSQIFLAIKQGDAAEAKRLMRAHIDNGSGRMAQKMQQPAQEQITAA